MSDATTDAAASTLDPYDQPPPWWRRHAGVVEAVVAAVLTVIATVVAFPPLDVDVFAYVCLAPGLFWAYRRPPLRRYLLTMWGAQAVAWIILLWWLRHVTVVGTIALGAFVGAWVGSWFLAAWWVMPRLLGRPTLVRILAMVGLAGAWVVIEWTRTWLLTGFPWLPLAVSQWHRIAILQIAAYTGQEGVSFVLVVMNFGFAAYAHRLLCEKAKGLARRSPEFMLGLFLLLVCLSVQVQETWQRGRFTVPLARFGIVQPDIAQTIKWDPAKSREILDTLDQQTVGAIRGGPELLLWPEATTPFAMSGEAGAEGWVDDLVARARMPLVMGTIVERDAKTPHEAWYNGACVVTPDGGVQSAFAAKRHLVPFGEYVPMRPLLGWLNKVVPVGDDFKPGDSSTPLIVPMHDRSVALGTLICYEDIFPKLAVASVRDGADALIVITNGGWYGREGMPEQQAAHSVLRAVETRRPVIRCGNAGWSGWIDEFGNIRAVLRQLPDGTVSTTPDDASGSGSSNGEDATAKGTIFFRGSATVDVTRDARWIGKNSAYVQHGDWFVALGFGLAVFAWLLLRWGPPAAPAESDEDVGTVGLT